MFKRRFTFSVVVAFIACLALASIAQAQGSQKFVSARIGKDTTTCTFNLPCRTFAAAILQAPPLGELIALDSGDYGPVTITKAVTIVGPVGGYAEIAVFFGPAVTIEAGVSDIVTLRGLTFNGSGLRGPIPFPEAPGILFHSGEALHIENCVINGFFGGGVFFLGAGQLFVKDTILRNGTRAGILIGPGAGAATASIDHCRLEKNGIGLVVSDNSKVTVRDTVAAGNDGGAVQNQDGIGFQALASASLGARAEITLENCVATGNKIGIMSIGNVTGRGDAIIRISNSTITNNAVGLLSAEGGGILSRGNNTVEGNRNNGAPTGTIPAK
jgi:hypothetical protein